MSGSFLPSLWSSINHSLLGSRGASIVMKSSAVLVRYPSATTFEITRTAFATTLWILGGNLQRLRSHKTQRVITTTVPKISRSNTGLMLPAIYGLSRFACLGIKRFGGERPLPDGSSNIILEAGSPLSIRFKLTEKKDATIGPTWQVQPHLIGPINRPSIGLR